MLNKEVVGPVILTLLIWDKQWSMFFIVPTIRSQTVTGVNDSSQQDLQISNNGAV